ncbi:methionyl-tRNA formyltransferase [Rhodoligotrophos ferricapiens]|uniref:methionyl-tRNA formyltransferase n=1 Tax=Rhodoligotrophos ferricapiens TaxID=3069264 RepID=UPI00315CF5E2
MRIAFVGAVEGSAIGLKALIDAEFPPSIVVTLPPEARFRHSDYVDLTPLANAAGSALLHATHVNRPEVVNALRAMGVDITLVIGWSQICGEAFRSAARIGSIGFHPAPLPRLRGRAVIPWTILLGESETAASLFWLDNGVDSGPILMQEPIEVSPEETARGLYAKQTGALARMLPKAIRLIRDGEAPKIPQDHGAATYCAKRTPEDGRIDWREPAEAILRLIRAVGDPYPGAFTTHNRGRLFIDEARLLPDSHRYIGLAGQVQCYTPDGFAVRCGDGLSINITRWRQEQGSARPNLHAKLGTPDQ